MNYKLSGPFGHYLAHNGAPWRGDYATALRLRYALAQRGQLMAIECPNHGGSWDCTPFCELCHGEQEIEKDGN